MLNNYVPRTKSDRTAKRFEQTGDHGFPLFPVPHVDHEIA